MNDPRNIKLAHLLVNYSCKVKPGEKVLIEAVDTPVAFVDALIKEVYAAGGFPLINLMRNDLMRTLMAGATEESLKFIADTELYRMKQVDCFIGVRGPANPKDLADLPHEKLALKGRCWFQPVHGEQRVRHTRWVVLRYPTQTMALLANMSTEAFEDYYFRVTADVDYEKMSRAMDDAVAFLKKADKVHILGPGTDLHFSIKGIGATKCDGRMNIPDGEVYSCPVRNSVNGTIQYNTKSTYDGFTFENVCLTFKDGRVIKATANDNERIEAVFNTDEGARYVGEFALGCNPKITFAMDDILFDEKIAGSFHFTPGNAYDDTDNGNRSAVHWDLVCIQTPEMGGGEIWIDGELIRKDGIFVHPAFTALNPEALD